MLRKPCIIFLFVVVFFQKFLDAYWLCRRYTQLNCQYFDPLKIVNVIYKPGIEILVKLTTEANRTFSLQKYSLQNNYFWSCVSDLHCNLLVRYWKQYYIIILLILYWKLLKNLGMTNAIFNQFPNQF